MGGRSTLRAGAACAALASLLVVGGCPFFFPPPPDDEPDLPSELTLQAVAQGFVAPVGFAAPPDGTNRLFIVDQIGLVRVIDGDGQLREAPFLDLRDRTVELGIELGGGIVFDERGLLGLALHPDFATNGRFFVFYNAPRGADLPEDFDSEVRVSEFRVRADDPNTADAASERLLIRIGKPQFNHNGGQLAFGPDGYLYISVGDGGGANDVGIGHTPDLGNGQDKSTLLGKILRIDVDAGNPYAIPPDNPFLGDPDAWPEIYALGLRNPWRFSFNVDETGAARLFVADVGQDLLEEINIVERGGNYGWNIREGTLCFDPDDARMPPASCPATGAAGEPLIDPIIEYGRADVGADLAGIAVIGGYVYRGADVPALSGVYVFGDWSTSFGPADGSIFVAAEASGNWFAREVTIAGTADGRLGRFVLAFGRDTHGELYVLTTENIGPFGTTGRVDRIVAAE